MSKKTAYLTFFFLLLSIVIGIKVVRPTLWEEFEQYLENRDILLLSSNQEYAEISGQVKRGFSRQGMTLFGEGDTFYYPFLLIYGQYRCPEEENSQLLWCLTTGELILDTQSFQKTAGMSKLISKNLTQAEITVLNELASFGGRQQEKQLLTRLELPASTIKTSCYNLQSHKLIQKEGAYYRLLVPRSHFFISPQTKWSSPLFLQKAQRHGHISPPHYSKEQVLSFLQNGIFGKGFQLDSYRLIYLPVYRYQIRSPNGKQFSVSWNGWSNKPLRNSDGY